MYNKNEDLAPGTTYADKYAYEKQKELDAIDLSLDHARSGVNWGKGLFYGGGLLACGGFFGAISKSESAQTTGIISMALDGGLWFTGIIVWVASAGVKEKLEKRRYQI